MTENDNIGLTIIKASAGSGKTHRLTLEYLKLVLSNPQKFINILAVTFTNKATAEMKSRIIKELQIIATTPDKSNMFTELAKELKIKPETLTQIAKDLVKSILHQYTYFNVSTIDHFFQNIIRNLTKELGLNGGFRIQLDQNEIIETAVDSFLHELSQNKDQMKIMLEYIDSQMDDEKSWNVNWHLVNFTKQLFREQVRYFFIKNNGSINGTSSTQEIKSVLAQTIKSFEKTANNWVATYDSLIEKANLQPEDFAGKSRNPLLSAKNKIQKKKYTELEAVLVKISKQDRWSHKDSNNCNLVDSLAPQFDLFYEELKGLYENQLPNYLEAIALQKHIFQHALASGLMTKVSQTLAEQNLFMLADAPVLLNLFTDGDDTPFIYEKSGRVFMHFMIDEFQDTSALQWENFKPLLKESLALGNIGNFIVGDVKQAIYRWRNGDWTLLHKKVKAQIQQSITETLNQNWRSKENIIQFNNVFFQELISTIGNGLQEKYKEELKEIYKDAHQNIPEQIASKQKGGYVCIKGIDVKKREEFIEQSLIELKAQISELKEEHNANDICILVRKNDELTAVSEYLINETNYEVISSGSLTLGSSNLLQIIIACIKYLNTPHDLYTKTIAFLLYQAKNSNTDLHQLFHIENNSLLPVNFDETIENLKQKSGLEIIEGVINAFDLHTIFPNQEIFITHFYNEVKKLIFEKGSNLETILEWWESKGEGTNIELSDANPSGIKVMTIHKSKGLQFQNVLLPFAQWSTPNKQDTLWLPGDTFSFPETNGGIFPVELNKSHLLCKHLSHFYEEENFASLIDIINVLYVATTRAIDSLHINYQRKLNSKNDISNYIEEIVYNQSELNNLLVKKEESTFELGVIKKYVNEQQKDSSQINILFARAEKIAVKTTKQNIFNPGIHENYAAEMGSLWHKIFERIIVQDDIHESVKKQEDLGNINETQSEIIIKQIEAWIANPEISRWFSHESKVLNEIDIIVPKSTTRRPDRVVIHENGTDIIDYKFGHKESNQYFKQVNEYCELFKEMGYQNVNGYIWYPIINKVIKTNAHN
jgi:ATP-dependent helicase/nuclease subunit A